MRNTPEESGPRILVATADIAYGAALARFLELQGYETDRCHDAKGVLRLAGRTAYDVIVLGLDIDAGGDIDLVSYVRSQSTSSQLVLVFEPSQIEQAIEGIRHGAFFYLPKSCEPADVALVAGKALRQQGDLAAMAEYERTLFEEMVGVSPAMKRVVELIRKVAPTDSTVLLLGESGTGKEVMANTVHRLSARRDQPFIAINCAALPENLLESEMFGHVRGAFTGAENDKKGLFEEAEGGTIFLDEVGDMALTTQAKLLRVLQSGEIRPVGSSKSLRVNVRVIAATNRDLIEAVQERTFREDLYFRLNVIQITIPPLRQRMDALPMLVEHFLRQSGQRIGKIVTHLDEAAQATLLAYDFPGNVRELESIITHAVIMSDGDVIRVQDLPDQVRYGGMRLPALPNYADDHFATLDEMERDLITATLARLDGNQTETAKRLGISRSTLWRKMKQYGLQGSDAN